MLFGNIRKYLYSIEIFGSMYMKVQWTILKYMKILILNLGRRFFMYFFINGYTFIHI